MATGAMGLLCISQLISFFFLLHLSFLPSFFFVRAAGRQCPCSMCGVGCVRCWQHAAHPELSICIPQAQLHARFSLHTPQHKKSLFLSFFSFFFVSRSQTNRACRRHRRSTRRRASAARARRPCCAPCAFPPPGCSAARCPRAARSSLHHTFFVSLSLFFFSSSSTPGTARGGTGAGRFRRSGGTAGWGSACARQGWQAQGTRAASSAATPAFVRASRRLGPRKNQKKNL